MPSTSTSRTEPLIKLRNLSVERGRRPVLHGLSVRVGRGAVALVGPNGSGKSTLLQTLATLLPFTAEHASVAGADLGTPRGAERVRRRIGYLPQEPTAFDHLTVGDACQYTAWLHLVPRSERAGAVAEVVAEFALEDELRRRLGRLSGGTRRRAYLAMTVVHRPPILLLDEPTTGLDASHRPDVLAAVVGSARSRLVLFSTHVAEDLTSSVATVLGLSEGRVSFRGTPSELRQRGRGADRAPGPRDGDRPAFARGVTVIAALRRSAGRTTFLVAVALVVAQIATRGHEWRHEWTWATYQTGFTTVLLAPAVAGSGALQGVWLARAIDLVRGAPRLWRLRWSAWLGVAAWGALAYLLGLTLAWIIVAASGTPGTPSPRDLIAVLPPLGLLAVAAATGLAVGWYFARLIAVPVAAVGCFAVILFCYDVGPAALVTVGGATGSLVGLEPRLGVEFWQTVTFSLLTATAVMLVLRRRVPGRAVWSAGMPVAAALLSVGADRRPDAPGSCLPAAPRERCALRARGAPDLHRRRVRPGRADGAPAPAPYVTALVGAGVHPVPERFDQTAVPGEITTGPLTAALLAGRRSDAVQVIIAAYVSKPCAASGVPAEQAWSVLAWFLQTTVDHETIDDPSLPTDLTTGPPARRDAALRAAVTYLVACSGH